MATLRHRKPENWLDAIAGRGHGLKEERPLGPSEQASEALLMGLRLAEGVDLTALSSRFAIQADALIDPAKLALYDGLGLAWRSGERIGATPQGMPLLDALLGELVPAALVAA
jgi:oxygen-independent coproporphyrinogen-3 oxidase